MKVEKLQATVRQQQQGGGGGGRQQGLPGTSSGGEDTGASARASSGGYSRLQFEELQRRADQYRLAYEDSERTHQLRDQTESALKEEVAKQQVGVGGALMEKVAGQDSFRGGALIGKQGCLV